LVLLLESIYEGLAPDESREFFKDIPDAIGKDGRDLSLVKWAFLRDMFKSLPPQNQKIKSVIDPVIEGMELLAAGLDWPADAAYAAAAYAAADAAADAAAYAAYDAAYAAGGAADVAYAATARAGERKRQAASILALISAA
jgi:hypothetical protein